MSDTPAPVPAAVPPAPTPAAVTVETVKIKGLKAEDDKTQTTTTVTTVQPGWKTSEFWQSIVVTVAGAAAFVWGIINGNEFAMMTGLGVMGVSSGAYSLSRGRAKA